MAEPVRLVVAVECTARLGVLWPALLQGVIEPLLAHQQTSELGLALVAFGAHPPHSLAAVESSLGWVSSAEQFLRLVDELDFVGGGGQPVALADALLEAATLFAQGAGAEALQCVVCLASEPSTRPVPWPCHEDCTMAKLPGLATSVELCRALQRRGIHLGFAGSNLLGGAHLWHLANLVSDTPLSQAEARLEQLRQQQEGALQRVLRAAVTLPGGAMAVLPSWPQALDALLAAGAKRLPAAAALAASKPTANRSDTGGAVGFGDSLEPVPPAAGEPGAKWATAAASSQAAAAADAFGVSAAPAATLPSPAGLTPPQQWTPPGAQPTPPTASPGSFWELINAEIVGSPEDAARLGDAMLAPMPQQAAPQPARQGPSVPGLPLPPVQQAQHAVQPPVQPQQQQPLRHDAASPGEASYVAIHSARVFFGPKITRSNSLMLGVGQVEALPRDAAALRRLAWPPELHIAKSVALASAKYVSSKPGCVHARLRMVQYASQDAQALPARLLKTEAAGIITLASGMLGVLLPCASPGSQDVGLQLVVVPHGSSV